MTPARMSFGGEFLSSAAVLAFVCLLVCPVGEEGRRRSVEERGGDEEGDEEGVPVPAVVVRGYPVSEAEGRAADVPVGIAVQP